MGKRVIAILTAIVVLLSSVVMPVGAAQTVSYSVYAFTGGDSSNTIYNTVLNAGNKYVYGGVNYTAGGYSIQIPANSQSGYLIVAGIYPIYTYDNYGSGWKNPTVYVMSSPYYHLSSSIGYSYKTDVGSSNRTGEVFNGIVYIPAHNGTLYLNVFTSTPGNQQMYYGAYRYSNATIQFIPDVSGDSGGTDKMVQQLQQVNQNIQNVYNEIHSSPEQDTESQQMLEELEKLSDQIEELSQQLNTVIERPPAEQVIPSIGEMLKPSDEGAEAGMEALGGIFSFPVSISLLVLAMTFSIISWVLYGKVR